MNKKYIKLFSYYGGKWNLLDKLLPVLMVEHDVFIEPFAGSAAVTINKTVDENTKPRTIINDLDPDSSFFLRIIQNKEKTMEIMDCLAKLKVSEELFETARKKRLYGYPNCSDIHRAVYIYLQIILSFNASRKNYRQIPQKQFNGASKDFMAVSERLSTVEVYNDDALEIIKQHKNNQNTLMYIDPPYCKDLRVAGEVYTNELGISDQIRLLNMLADAKAKIVLSGYLGEDRESIYDKILLTAGWTRYLLCETLKSSSTAESKPIAREYIWVNYDLEKLPFEARQAIDFNTKTKWETLFEERGGGL